MTETKTNLKNGLDLELNSKSSEKQLTKFEKLCELNVNSHCETKSNGSKDLTYLSWTWAWKYFKTEYPDATYIVKHWDGVPYHYDPNLGYMCETEITAGGETYGMWLPVMDGANKAQKAEAYTYTTKSGEKTVQAATMFDINTTIMRCLVKNMAMFGLGLYIYSGEDIPELSETTKAIEKDKHLGALKTRVKTRLDALIKKCPELNLEEFSKYAEETDEEKVLNIGIALKKICETQGITDEDL